MGKILELIPQLMEEIGVVPKNGKNQSQNYRFRGIDDVMNAVQPALVKLKITPTYRCEDIFRETVHEAKAGGGERLMFRTAMKVVVTLKADDGSFEEYSAAGEGIDYGGDKSSNKAMSGGYKYALGHGLCIPFEDIDDPDRDQKQPTRELTAAPGVNILAAAQAVAPPTTVATPASGLDPLHLVHGDQNAQCAVEQRNRIVELAKKIGMPPAAISDIVKRRNKERLDQLTVGQAFEIVGNLEKLCTDKKIPL